MDQTMDILQTLILAIIQGITEWLPISSSGHLAIAEKYFGKSPLTFDIALHVGTIFVVLITFRKDVIDILKAFFGRDFESEEGKLALFIIVGSIPTAIIGFLLLYFDIIETLRSNLFIVGSALLVTGIFLYASGHVKGGKELNYIDSVLIGIAQGIATIPGISRSGFTISTGLLRKGRREKVFKYSFLLSIPAVLGAMVATIIKEHESLTIGTLDVSLMVLGAITSFIIGYMALQLLQKIFMKQKFHLFAYYCWIIGLATILLHFL
jgi:undecaprenyl-diphosphatase